MPIERDRERAKRRYARRQQVLQARAARARRNQQVVGAVVAVLLVAVGVVLLTRMLADGTPAAAGASPTGTGTASSGATPSSTVTPTSYKTPPPKTLAKGAVWQGDLTTSAGKITLQLDGAKAPQTVSSFIFLSQEKFFDGTRCHRLTTSGIYVLQCGDPTGTGSGGPGYGYGIENAPSDGKYPAGTVAMARSSDPNSNGSQFFLVYQDSTLPTQGGGYTIFGKVTAGLDVLKKVAAAGTADGSGDGAPKKPVTITSISVEQR